MKSGLHVMISLTRLRKLNLRRVCLGIKCMPVSFSVGCNLEGVETCHVSSKDAEVLIAKLVGTLLEMANKKY